MDSETLVIITVILFTAITITIGINFGFFTALIFYLCVFLTGTLLGKMHDDD